MPLASRRDDDEYQTFLAYRPDASAVFERVEPVVNLREPGTGMLEAFLTDDGLSLYFNRTRNGVGDLYFSWRASIDEPFGAATLLPDVNSLYDDRDPWSNLDSTRFFFSSDRRDGNGRDIYATWSDVPPMQ